MYSPILFIGFSQAFAVCMNLIITMVHNSYKPQKIKHMSFLLLSNIGSSDEGKSTNYTILD